MSSQVVLSPEKDMKKKWPQKAGVVLGIIICVILIGFFLVPEKKSKNFIGHYYFKRYLTKRPSPVADKFARKALIAWSQSGNLTSLEYAAEKINPESPLWRDFFWFVEGGYRQSRHYEQFGPFLHRIENKVANTAGKMALNLKLGEFYRHQDKMIAAGYFERVLKIDADPILSAQARGNLHDVNSLNIGQGSPGFALSDIGGHLFSNNSTQGKIVVLFFWSVECPGCLQEIHFYKKIYDKYKSDVLLMLGISVKVGERTRQFVVEEKLGWPQVILNEEDYHEIQQNFNIQYVPDNYVIDPAGKIAAKHLLPEELEETIKELVETYGGIISENE